MEWQAANIYTHNTYFTQYSFLNKALDIKSDPTFQCFLSVFTPWTQQGQF